MSELVYRERPASREPAGLLILHHGRGADERDLLGVAELLDREHRLHVVTPRAPLQLPGSPGYHWYLVPRVGYPDPATFHAARHKLAALDDELWGRTGIPPERTVLAGFSMGSVMSYATGLSPERPAPAGILAFSGFVPVVDGWQPSPGDRRNMRVFIAHGSADPVIEVGFGRRSRDFLTDAGLEVEYHEHGLDHQIDVSQLGAARRWLSVTLGQPGSQEADAP